MDISVKDYRVLNSIRAIFPHKKTCQEQDVRANTFDWGEVMDWGVELGKYDNEVVSS